MATLLRIDSSPLGDRSFTRNLTDEFVQNWLIRHPDGKVITRDVTATELKPLDAEWIAAAYTPEDLLTQRQQYVLKTSDQLIAELVEADEYVVGVPMHNFSIPGTLKLWIDQVARRGKTFAYASGGPVGLLQGKKATFLVASGGNYELGTPAAAMNFVEPYLRSFFAFLGVKDTTFINAGGTSKIMSGIDRATILQPAITAIRAQL